MFALLNRTSDGGRPFHWSTDRYQTCLRSSVSISTGISVNFFISIIYIYIYIYIQDIPGYGDVIYVMLTCHYNYGDIYNALICPRGVLGLRILKCI